MHEREKGKMNVNLTPVITSLCKVLIYFSIKCHKQYYYLLTAPKTISTNVFFFPTQSITQTYSSNFTITYVQAANPHLRSWNQANNINEMCIQRVFYKTCMYNTNHSFNFIKQRHPYSCSKSQHSIIKI